MYVVISGAGRGLGKAMAIRFAKAGYDLFLCARDLSKLEAVRKLIQQSFPTVKVEIMHADLTVKSDAERFANHCLRIETPHVLINNAGIYTPGKCMDGLDDELKKMLDINLYTAWNLTHAFLPSMLKNGKGHIFNLCSIASLQAYRDGGYYGVGKYALLGFTRNLRLELLPHNIKVTAVFPGATLTDSWGEFDNSEGRIMVAEDVAEMVFAATQLSPQAVVEDIVMRPQLGDL